MRILTGRHRREWEQMLTERAELRVRVTWLEGLKKDLDYERERANTAIDALLVGKGHPPISPPRPEDLDRDLALFEEDPEVLKDQRKRISQGEPVMDEAKDKR